MSKSAFPFRAARPKGAQPAPPAMSFDLPAAPPPSEVPFNEPEEAVEARVMQTDETELHQAAEAIGRLYEQPAEETEDMARKAKNGRRKPQVKVGRPPKSTEPRFTFAEVAEVFGEDVPFVKVVARIVPVIEVLEVDERKRVVEILMRLFG